jgi:hypothetical protein
MRATSAAALAALILATTAPAAAQSPAPAACDNPGLIAAQKTHADETAVTLCGVAGDIGDPKRIPNGELHRYFTVDAGGGNKIAIDVNLDAMHAAPPLVAGQTVLVHGWYYWHNEHEGVHWTHHTESGPHPGGYIVIGSTTYD